MSVIKKNQFKQALNRDKPIFGLWQGIPDTSVAEIGAGAGFDWLLIDAEHGPFDLKSVMLHLQAVEPYPVSTIVRPAEGTTALIKRLLDVGAQTLLIPMVDTAEQAKQVVAAAKYPPTANWNRTTDYLDKANDEICVIAQIETLAGLKNIEEIVNIDGVDAVFIGPSDLSAAMGHIGNPSHPEVVTAIEDAFKLILESGKQAGVLAVTKALADKYVQAGARFIGVGVDAALLANATHQLAAQYIEAASDTEIAGY